MKNILINDIVDRNWRSSASETVRQSAEDRMYNYLLLNSSFSDDIGLISGRAICTLYMYESSRYKASNSYKNVAFGFLDELLSSIDNTVPLFYENGLSGIGVLIEYLSSNGFLEETSNELLNDVDPIVLGKVFFGDIDEIGMSSGISGIGMFCLMRLNSNNDLAYYKKMRLTEAVISCVDFIEASLNNNLNGYRDVASIFDGYAGVMLFVKQVDKLGFYRTRTTALLDQINSKLVSDLLNLSVDWSHIEAIFSIIYCTNRSSSFLNVHIDRIRDFVFQYLKDDLRNSEICCLAFSSMWCDILHSKFDIKHFDFLSQNIASELMLRIQTQSMQDLFPFSNEAKSIGLGLRKGICGVALPILSISFKNYNWLNIFGINTLQ